MLKIVDVIAIVICLIGTFITCADSFSICSRFIDRFTYWKDINIVIEKLETKKQTVILGEKQKTFGSITKLDNGFVLISKIIKRNKPNLKDLNFSGIYLASGTNIGGQFLVRSLCISVSEGVFPEKCFATNNDLHLWLKYERDRFLLIVGLCVIVIGTIISILVRIFEKSIKPLENSLGTSI